jgi:TIR domain
MMMNPLDSGQASDHVRRTFIPYRRTDTQHAAGGLADRLALLPGVEISMDVEKIRPGANFHITVDEATAASEILIALIGPAWLSAPSPRSRPSLWDRKDPVAREIRSAFMDGVYIIPVLIDGLKSLQPRSFLTTLPN